jgi:hypothetical protein
MLNPLLQQVFDAIFFAPDFHHFHEDDELIPGRTVGQLEPQIRRLVEMNLLVRELDKPDPIRYNMIQIANPAKNPKAAIAMGRFARPDI